ncbi:MAG: hypothetical protein GTN76_16625 [Candidatus Aenigmarchaeota archaeon]|nr:hypothetical protein [Candidatus Aenigmarchaeota archaeon]
MRRRDFLKKIVFSGLSCCLNTSRLTFGAVPEKKKNVLILGIDGMDPHLTLQYMHQGLLPNFSKLAGKGGISTLGTSIPPQSPVAWSNFIAGGPSYVHGIYDFIHRDPGTMAPYFSISKVTPPDRILKIGKYNIPLSKGRVENLRKGKPFWDFLAERDIPTTIFKIPTNFPCENKRINMTSGMGTPDLRGGYGSYSFFTTAPNSFRKKTSGGKVVPVVFEGEMLRTELSGPENIFLKNSPKSSIPIRIWRDHEHPVLRVLIQDRELLLKEGEWSSWIPLSFPMLKPGYDVKGIVKIYVKSVRPDFGMYVSPINIDPSDPALPVVSSKEYGEDLVRNVGYFYTQGFPEDTKALSEGILDEQEYLDLAYQILFERGRLLDFELKRFLKQKTGLLFFYFSSLDQNSHMYYRTIDPQHPLYDAKLGKQYGTTLQGIYAEMDRIFGEIITRYDIDDPNNTLIVMSDHGFVSFRRQVNVNTWLYENGFLALDRKDNYENGDYFANVKWSKTAAYNVGINSIYLNMRGRESSGILSRAQVKGLISSLRDKLLKLVDLKTGKKAISRVWVVRDIDRIRNPHAPDLIIGWNAGYRTSWSSILGGFSNDVFTDNLDKWSGDHCVDSALVPGTLVTNRKIIQKNPNLHDVTATILKEFGIPGTDQILGNSLF